MGLNGVCVCLCIFLFVVVCWYVFVGCCGCCCRSIGVSIFVGVVVVSFFGEMFRGELLGLILWSFRRFVVLFFIVRG